MKTNWQPPTTSFFLLILDKILVTTPDIDNIELAKASGDKKQTDFLMNSHYCGQQRTEESPVWRY